jgi:hypothetical protein
MMLTKYMARQRLLLVTEQELHAQLEKRAQKEHMKQHATAEATANRGVKLAEMETTLLVDAMMQQITDTARSDALTTRATREETHAACETTFAIARAGKHQAPCSHKGSTHNDKAKR